MTRHNDQQLLREYAERQSEAAFSELVRRHVSLVYSAALRMVCDAHLAEDVTQGTFIALAQNARQLTGRPVLSGWLHRTAQNLASKSIRTEVRRRVREQEVVAMNQLLSAETLTAWEHIAPHLDAALGALSEPERDALLLRYFEGKSAHEMAQTLGINDDAAQKRVSRAVERLRAFFAKRGVTVGASGLVVVISANAVQAAPVGLVVTISTAAALAGATATTLAASTTMNWINLKTLAALITVALAAGTVTHFVQQRETDRLRSENQSLIMGREQLTKERDAALSAAVASQDELKQSRSNKLDLLRLRGEVGTLRQQSGELVSLRKENAQLQQLVQLKSPPTNLPPVLAKVIITRIQQPQLLGEEQIRTNISVRAGDIFDQAALDLDVQNLYASGLFYNVRVLKNPTAEGVVLNYFVQEKPALTAIQFAGNVNYSAADLSQFLASKVGKRLDERSLSDDADKLQELYRKSGFANSAVKYKVKVNEDNGEGTVVFNIAE